MGFNSIFNSILFILWQPVHLSILSWSSFNQYSAQYSIQATGCLPTQPLLRQGTAVREEWILSQWLSSILRKNIGRAGDRTSDLVVKVSMLPTELRAQPHVLKKILFQYLQAWTMQKLWSINEHKYWMEIPNIRWSCLIFLQSSKPIKGHNHIKNTLTVTYLWWWLCRI